MNVLQKRAFIANACKKDAILLPDGATLTDIRQNWTVERCDAWLIENNIATAQTLAKLAKNENADNAPEAAPEAKAVIAPEAAPAKLAPVAKKAPSAATGSIDDAIKALIEATAPKSAPIDESAVRAIVADALAGMQSTRVEIVTGATIATIDNPHPRLTECVQWLATGANLLFTGPAGCGKTFLAEQCAKALNLEFGLIGAVTMAHEIVGYCDATGNYRDTPISRTFRDGGLSCLDELDAGSEQALLSANAVLSNGVMAQGSQMVARHASWRCIATANTAGTGATMTYNGRTKLDGATVDRFVVIELTYDATIEKQLAGNNGEWLALCRKARDIAAQRGMLAAPIGTYRAIKTGAQMLATGASLKTVASGLLARGGLTLSMIGL